jgi:hypothetical protein
MAYDWNLIKREYVQGCPDEKGVIKFPTLDHLCERHGCSLSTIMKKSSTEKWKQERKLFGRKKEEKIEEKKIEAMAEESANIDNKALTASELGIDKGLKRLEDKDLSIHDYQKLSIGISNFHKMGKLALGEPTEHTKNEGSQRMEIDHNVKIPDNPTIRTRGRAVIQSIRSGQVEPGDSGNGNE